MTQLPAETLAQIATELDLVSLISVQQTCSCWRQVCRELQPIKAVVSRMLKERPASPEQLRALMTLARRGDLAGHATFKHILANAQRSFIINWLEVPLLPDRIWRDAFHDRFVTDVVHQASTDTSLPWRAKYWK